MILKTSNKFKIKDYEKINFKNLIIKEGESLPEVDGTIDEIIIYKTLLAETDELVEDSTIIYNNKEYIDIKHNINILPENEDLYWIVSIGLKRKKKIEIYKSIVRGKLINNKNINGSYDMNKIFIPFKENDVLEKLEKYHTFTPRYKSLLKLKRKEIYKSIEISKINKWTGKYQKD